eukprot:gene20286-25736_t
MINALINEDQAERLAMLAEELAKGDKVLELNKDAPMAGLLNRGMVAALIGIFACFALYDYIHNWRLLLSSADQAMRLSEDPFVTVGALIAVSGLTQSLWPKGSALILPTIGVLGVVLLITVGVRVYALTSGLEALHWDYWMTLI